MKKIKYLIISHGHFADGLKESIEMISGPHNNLKTLCLLKEMAPETFGELIEEEIIKNNNEDYETMIFADLLGGTPFNTLIPLLRKYSNISFITGVNLAMCLEIICNDTFESLQEIENVAKECGQKSIITKTDLFNSR